MHPEALAADEAIELYRRGRFRDALARFESLIDESPEPGIHCYWAGLAARALGEMEEAADHLFLASHHLARDERVWLALGETLLAAGRAEEALDALRKCAAIAADPASALRVSASALKTLGRHDEAVDTLAAVVAARPGDAADRSTLALALLRAGRIDEAAAEARTALRLDPDCVEACHHAGLVERELGALGTAADLFRRAHEARPDSLEVRSALAHALRDLGRTDEALAHYDAVLERHPGFADAALNRAYLLLMVGRYAEGWDAYEGRFAFPGFSPPPEALGPWTGRGGERVLVFGEQGLGDQVMFASCLPDLCALASEVRIACHPGLAGILGRSFPRAGVYPQDQLHDATKGMHAAVSIASLPRHFRRKRTDFPSHAGYLKPDGSKVARWAASFAAEAGTSRVGLAWRGGSMRTRGHLRSVPPRALAALAVVPRVRWVSLQYGDAAADVGALRASGMKVERWDQIEHDIEECAAAIQALDLVVSIDNTIAHLAGALGKPVWILLNPGAEWRYGLGSGVMPWYPSARLYRQGEREDWEAVLRKVVSDLEAACPPA